MSKAKLDIESVKWVDIKSIKLWKGNPRKNEGAAKKLAPILKEHGIKSPLVVWKKDKTIYKGNTTYKAAKLLVSYSQYVISKRSISFSAYIHKTIFTATL